MLVIKTLISFLKNKEYLELLITTFIVIAFGAVAYRYLEDWSWVDSIYFTVVTLTTVGFGDFAPQTDGGKIFTIFYIIIGVGIILSFINTIYNHYNSNKISHKKNQK